MALLKYLRASLSGGPYYVRIRRDRLTIRDVRGGGYFDDEPLVALTQDDPPKIEAIGAIARTTSSITINPFDHPRVFVADFLVAERVLNHAFRVVAGGRPFRVAPIAVVHVTEDLEGGLSPIETRAIHELFDNVGARKTYFWDGRELTDDELRSGVYRNTV